MKLFLPCQKVYRVTFITAALLLIPLFATLLSDEVGWAIGDFIVAFALIFSSGYAYQLLTQSAQSRSMRIVIGVAIAVILAVVWALLATQ